MGDGISSEKQNFSEEPTENLQNVKDPKRKNSLSEDLTETIPKKKKTERSLEESLNSEGLKQCKRLLNDLRTSKTHWDYAVVFHNPVDTRMLNCPDYYEIIEKPMDLSTMQAKMINKKYPTIESFADDMRLMINNCFRYNPPENPVIKLCQQFQTVFEFRFKNILDRLEEMKVKQTQQQLERTDSNISNSSRPARNCINPADTEETVQRKIFETNAYLSKLHKQLDDIIRNKLELSTAGLQKSHSKSKKSKGKTMKKNESEKGDACSSVEMQNNKSSNESEDEDIIPMTYEQKRQLSIKMNTMPGKLLREAINLIKKNEPELITDNNDEFEVDFEVMKAKTLRDLEKFVNDTMNPKKQRKRAVALKKVIDPNEVPGIKKGLESEKEELQNRLEILENQLGLRKANSPVKTPPPPPSSSSSSSSSGSSSSSSGDSSSSDSSSDD